MGGLFSSVDPNDRYQQKVLDPSAGMGYGQTVQNAQAGFAANQQGQTDYIQSLKGQAAGSGPSVAEQMLQQQTQRNATGNASAIASQRGMNPALASKMLLDQNAAGQQTAAGQGATMRAGEMLNAQSLLGHALGQQGQQSLGAMSAAGGLQNQGYLGAAGINAGLATSAANNSGLKAITGGAASGAGAAMGFLSQGASGPLGGADSAIMASSGALVPGHAMSPGDSPRNDTVSAKLSPGEIVLPRSVTQGDDAPEAARRFVQAVLRRKGVGKAKHHETLHHVRKAKQALDALAAHMGDES